MTHSQSWHISLAQFSDNWKQILFQWSVESTILLKFPCGICKKGVRKNQKAIFCDACDHWVHANCNGVKDKEYCELQEQDDDIPWFCLPCEISKNAELFPFGLESNLELLDLYSIDILSHLKSLPSYETHSRLSKFNPTCKTLTLMKISFIQ